MPFRKKYWSGFLNRINVPNGVLQLSVARSGSWRQSVRRITVLYLQMLQCNYLQKKTQFRCLQLPNRPAVRNGSWWKGNTISRFAANYEEHGQHRGVTGKLGTFCVQLIWVVSFILASVSNNQFPGFYFVNFCIRGLRKTFYFLSLEVMKIPKLSLVS